MRRRDRPGRPAEIPIEIMGPDGSHGPEWGAWCEANGWSKVAFLRECLARRHAWYDVPSDDRYPA